jgi:hypothetical protein
MRTRVLPRELVNGCGAALRLARRRRATRGAAWPLVFAAMFVACAGPRPRAPRGEVVVSFEGKVENGPFRFGKGDLALLPRRSFKAISPVTGKEASFDGLDVSTILSDEMELGKGVDIAIVHGQNGYAVHVPIAALRQLKPILADKENGAPVAAPLQLAWPNVDQPGIDTDPRMRWWWVGGVKKVEMQSWFATYGKALRVPQGSSDDARLGAESISIACMACHKVRGVGGTRGPELRFAAVHGDLQAFSESMREHLAKESGMVAAPLTSSATARQIAAFLRAIDLAGSRPDEEAPVEQSLPPPRAPGGYGPGIGPGPVPGT